MSDIQHIVSKVEETLTPLFKEIEETAYINQEKVLNAFHHVKASENDLVGSTGYGYDDFGRDHLEEIYAHTFKAEDALVRPQIISGTHAITLALQSTLKYGDELMYITGSPYDTLLEVIGVNGNGIESLKEHGVTYKEVALKDGMIDVETVLNTISKQTKVIAIQRSKGYGQRPSITVDEIETAISQIKQRYPNVIIFVDNCYGVCRASRTNRSGCRFNCRVINKKSWWWISKNWWLHCRTKRFNRTMWLSFNCTWDW